MRDGSDRVSVIIPTRNRPQKLRRAVTSVIHQTVAPVEIIVVDDASTDETAIVLDRLEEEFAVVQGLRNRECLGGAAARNAGAARAQGAWLAFLDDDDVWHSRKLERQLSVLNRTPQAVAASCGFKKVDQTKTPIQHEVVYPPRNTEVGELLEKNLLGSASLCVCRRSVFQQIEGFDSRLESAQDWDLWIRLRQEGPIFGVQEVLATYFVHTGTRITTDVEAKVAGENTFYRKHQRKMDAPVRSKRKGRIYYWTSMSPDRSVPERIVYLLKAVWHSDFRSGAGYLYYSLCQLIKILCGWRTEDDSLDQRGS